MSEFGRILRLTYWPLALDEAAMHVRMVTAIVAGTVTWLASGAIVLVGLHDVFPTKVVTLIGWGGIGVTPLMLLALLATCATSDGTTWVQRLRLRMVLLLPFCTIVPLAAWALAARWSRDHGLRLDFVVMWGLGALVVVMAVLPMIAARKLAANSAEKRCIECGYMLIGLTTRRCPECGREF